MNTNAVMMNSIPFASIAPVVLGVLALGIAFITAKVVKVELANRREARLNAMNANPELAALGMPVPQLDNAGNDQRVDTGTILRQEGFSV